MLSLTRPMAHGTLSVGNVRFSISVLTISLTVLKSASRGMIPAMFDASSRYLRLELRASL